MPPPGNEMTRSEQFLRAYNRIDHHLRKVTRLGRAGGFPQVVDEAAKSDAAARTYRDDLKELGDLRNAIVHERGDGRLLAEPNDQAVAEIERLAERLLAPPHVYPAFQAQVTTLPGNASIGAAVAAMHDNGYSQIPIMRDSVLDELLTSDTIARWLGQCAQQDIFSLSETCIDDVLQLSEEKDNYMVVARDMDVFEVLGAFHQYPDKGKRIEAILITNAGRPSEQLIGIVTVWDLPKLHSLVDLRMQ